MFNTSGHRIKLPIHATISGSTVLSQVLTIPSRKFRGMGNWTLIPLQLRLSVGKIADFSRRTHLYQAIRHRLWPHIDMSAYPVLRNGAWGSQEIVGNGKNKVKLPLQLCFRLNVVKVQYYCRRTHLYQRTHNQTPYTCNHFQFSDI